MSQLYTIQDRAVKIGFDSSSADSLADPCGTHCHFTSASSSALWNEDKGALFCRGLVKLDVCPKIERQGTREG